MKLIDIETELGNQIIKDLINDGWKKVREYSPLAFDKGIDFDHYVFKRDKVKLTFKWNNWFEWEVSGAENELYSIAKKYDLSLNQTNNT